MSADILQSPIVPLTSLDRCDRCGAQAYVRIEMPNTLELLFCGHDWRQHGDKLRDLAVSIQDETEKLSQ